MAEETMQTDFWSQRKVLVTGHTGFKGSWLTIWLKQMGADVVGYSLAPPTDPSLFHAAGVAEGIIDLRGDVRDADRVAAAIDQHRPKVIFHLAAQPLVRRSYVTPVETYATNVMGTVHVLEAVRQSTGVEAVVVVTSDKCYENKEWLWGYRESDPLGGFDPYSSSKGCAELVTAAYRQSFFQRGDVRTAVASARAGNVIGGGDWAADRLIPDIVRALRKGEPVEIRNPQAVRPWQHVLEPLRGYMMLAQRLCLQGDRWSGAWNFGPRPQDARPVSAVADMIVELWGDGGWSSPTEHDAPHEANLLNLDCSKAHRLLGWSPWLSLREALAMTVRWYAAALASPGGLSAVSQHQIESYMDGANEGDRQGIRTERRKAA